nr:hypothetical protein [Tanacetum cinerariifolium]
SNVVTDKAINVVADKVDVAKDKINVQDDPAKVVKESVLAVAKNKPAGDGKSSAPDVVKERHKTMLPKYKPNNKVSSVGKRNVPTELHKDKVLDVVSKDKPKGNASSVVVRKVGCCGGKAGCCEGKVAVVKEKLAVVKEKLAVVKEKCKTEKNSKALDNPNESDKAVVIESDKHKADVVKPSNVVTDKAINVVADKVDVAKDKINVQDDPAKVVKESVLAVAKNKPAGDGKSSAPDVVKERHKTMLPKYKPNNKVSSVGKRNVPTELHKDKVLDVVSKDKPKGNASSVVVSKDKRKENYEKDIRLICYSK